MRCNKSVIPFVVIFLFCHMAGAQPPDILWQEVYGGTEEDACYSVYQTSDNGYILGGYTSSFGAGFRDMYIMKVDSSGNLQWDATFGGPGAEECCWIQQTSDGGYAAGGHTESYGAGYRDMYLVKLDATGNLVWSQTYGGPDYDRSTSGFETPDGGFILAGYTESYGIGDYDFYLVKTDSVGVLQWEWAYGGLDDDKCHSVDQTSDGGFILGGEIDYIPSSGTDVYIIKTDSLGLMDWEATYGGTQEEQCRAISQTTDGGYMVAGNTTSFSISGMDFYLIKTDANGNMEWNHSYGGYGWEDLWDAQPTTDGGYILAGYVNSYSQVNGSGYIVKTDSLGTLIWHQAYGGMEYDRLLSVRQLAGEDYMAAGFTHSFGADDADAYLVHLAAGGSPPQLPLTLTPESSPIIIPAMGGSFNYLIELQNPEDIQQLVDVWFMVTLPDSTQYGPILGPFNLILNAVQTIERDRSQAVPPNAPAGDYLFTAYAGIYPDIFWGGDSISFTKTGVTDGSTFDGFPADNLTCLTEENNLDAIKFALPLEYAVSAYPNPFNPSTVISYTLQGASHVSLSVFDVTGKKVTELVDGQRDAGMHEVTFDATGLASGMYFYRLTAGECTSVGKMVLMK